MGIIKQKEYLLSKGLNPDDKTEEVRLAKREHRKLYQKEYKKNYWKRMLRIELSLAREEYHKLSNECKKYGMSIANLIKLLAFSYLEQIYVAPNEDLINALQIGIRRIGNNLNQVVVKVNSSNTVFQSDLKDMQKRVKELEDEMSRVFRNPIKLKDLLRAILKERPEAAKDMWEVLKETGYDNKISGTQDDEL